MKRILTILLSVLLLCSFTACTNKTEKDLYDTIKEKGYITVAMEGTWAPWTYHNEANELVGFDVEVAKAIAKELGVEVHFVEAEFNSCLAGLDSGRYDIVVNGIDVTESRKEKYYFSNPYAYGRIALIVRKNNSTINSFEDLKGKTTCNTSASSYAELALSYGAESTPVDSLDQTFTLVTQGRIDATLNSIESFNDYKNAHPDTELEIRALTENPTLISIPMRKEANCESLRDAINKAIDKLMADGTIASISMKYFNMDISK